jgi:hypothetical protein
MNTLSKDGDPLHHITHIKQILNDLVHHVREDVAKASEPKTQALFETTAEVLPGLATAYDHYEANAEPAWR